MCTWIQTESPKSHWLAWDSIPQNETKNLLQTNKSTKSIFSKLLLLISWKLNTKTILNAIFCFIISRAFKQGVTWQVYLDFEIIGFIPLNRRSAQLFLCDIFRSRFSTKNSSRNNLDQIFVTTLKEITFNICILGGGEGALWTSLS